MTSKGSLDEKAFLTIFFKSIESLITLKRKKFHLTSLEYIFCNGPSTKGGYSKKKKLENNLIYLTK